MTSAPKRTQRRIASDEAETVALLHAVALFQAHRAGSSYRQWQQVADAVVAQLGTFKGSRWSRDTFHPRRAEQLYKQLIAQFRVAVASNGTDAPLPQNAVLRELLEKTVADEDHAARHDAMETAVDMRGDSDESMETSEGGTFAGATEEEEKNEEVATPLHQATRSAGSQSGLPRARRASAPTLTRFPPIRASRQLPLMSLSLPSTPAIVMNPVVSSRKRLWDARLEASRRAVRRTVNLTPSATPLPPHTPVEELVMAEPNTGDQGLEALDAEMADDLLNLLADDPSPGQAVKRTPDDVRTTDAPEVRVSGDDQASAMASLDSPPHEPHGTSERHAVVAPEAPKPDEEQEVSRDPLPAGDPAKPDPPERNTVVTLTALDAFMAHMLSTMQDQQRTQTTLIQRVQSLTLEVAVGRQAHERLQSEVATLRSSHDALKHENTELRQSVAVLQADRMANGNATQLSTISNGTPALLSQVEKLQQAHATTVQKATALEERVDAYVNVCIRLQAEGTSMKDIVKVLTDRLQHRTSETESWQALVEELADHTRTLEETVGTHKGVIDAHASLLATQDSTLRTHDATCRALDSVTQRLQEKIELEVTERLALDDVVTAGRAEWTHIQQQWQQELVGLKERHGEQLPVEDEAELKRMKEEISICQEALARHHVRQQMRDDEIKKMNKRLEDRHNACTQQHVRVLRTIKAILDADA